jgi:hypothetical protein
MQSIEIFIRENLMEIIVFMGGSTVCITLMLLTCFKYKKEKKKIDKIVEDSRKKGEEFEQVKEEVRKSLSFEEAKEWAYRIKDEYEKYERETRPYFTYKTPSDEDIKHAMETGILKLRKNKKLSIFPFYIDDEEEGEENV